MSENTGCTLAQRLTSALLGLGLPYAQVSEIVYGELQAIADDQALGDWLSMPDGTTYEMTFKPSRANTKTP